MAPHRHDPRIKHDIEEIEHDAREIVSDVVDIFSPHHRIHPTQITFTEITMNPTAAGQTQVFTGTLIPDGSAFPQDAEFVVSSNDSDVSPVVDSTGLVVSVTYPDGWVESDTTPLVFAYEATSASNPTWTLTGTITPSAPPPPAAPPLPTSISFAQTT